MTSHTEPGYLDNDGRLVAVGKAVRRSIMKQTNSHTVEDEAVT